MALPRDAPMACKPENQATFLRTLNVLRADCIHLLEVHEHDIPDRYWRPGDPAAQTSSPRTANDRSRLKLCLILSLQPDHKPIFPPSNTRLSDELVYLATKFLKIRERADAYPYDFDVKGDINPSRIPSGVAPLVWAHGLPFFPVYKGYYILCGREHAKWIGWMLNRKEKAKTMSRFPVWTIGPVVAPASAVEMSRTVERQLRVHKATSTRHFEKGEEHRMAARDVVSTCHCDLSVVPRTPSVSGGYRVMPIYQVLGYNVRCGPDWNDSRRAAVVDRQVFVERGIDFDYSAALKLPLVNQRCPRAESDETVKHDGRLEGFLDELSPNEAQDPAHHTIENQGYAVSSSKENPAKDNIPSQADFTKNVQACEIELNIVRAVIDRDEDIFEYTKMQPVEWWLDISQRAHHALKMAMARLEDEVKQSSGSELPPRKKLKAETPCAEPKIEEKAEEAVSIYQEQAKPPLDPSLEIQSSADIPLLHPHTGNSKTSVTESVCTEINANEASLILGLPDQETKAVNEDTEMGEGVDIHDFHDEYLEHNEQAQENANAAEEKLQQESTAKSISSSGISSPTLRVSSRAREMEGAQMVLSTTPEMEIRKTNEEAAINAEMCRDRVRSPSWTDLAQADTAELAQVTAEDAGDIQSVVQAGENVGE